MDLFIIGKFIGKETSLGKQYLKFAVKNWLLGMWVEDAMVTENIQSSDQDLMHGSFYLLKAIPTAHRETRLFIEVKLLRGPI